MNMDPALQKSQLCKISRSKQRQIFITFCLLGLGAGLMMIGAGVFVAFDLGGSLKSRMMAPGGGGRGVAWNDDADEYFDRADVNRVYERFFSPEQAGSRVSLDLLVSNVGYTLLALGVVLLFHGMLGLLGATFRRRPILLLYLILMQMLILTEIVCFVMVVLQESPLSQHGCKVAREDLIDDGYVGPDGKEDPWLSSFYVIMVVLDCCGVDGPADFEGMYDDKHVPETCCTRKTLQEALRRVHASPPCTRQPAAHTGWADGKRHSGENITEISDDGTANTDTTLNVIKVTDGYDNILSDDCGISNSDDVERKLQPVNLSVCTQARPNTTGSIKHQKQKGCCDAIFEAIRSNLYWVIPVFVIVLLIQVASAKTTVFLLSKRLMQSECQLDSNPL